MVAHKETTIAVWRQPQELYFHGRRGVRHTRQTVSAGMKGLCSRPTIPHTWRCGPK
jgi:hypothetical protein